jgi:pimeloyl-ACP methyl ester carboxylesterase
MSTNRSPAPVIAASLTAGSLLAIALLLGPATRGTEPVITGSVLIGFGIGWALVALLTTRYSAQPQRWARVPAAVLGFMGLSLVVLQPGPGVMDALSWGWPLVIGILAVWIIAQVRRHLAGRGRWFVVPAAGTLLLLAVGGGIATVGAALGTGAPAMPGQLLDVGGRRLYIECSGTGSPAVVLQSGIGESTADWAAIAHDVAASTTVCVYDRAGHGRSDEASGPQDGIALATDLHGLLERAGVPGPYVLVGHSSGGPYVRVFAERYPDEVAGMVLVDAQPADAFSVLPDYPAFYEPYRTVMALGPSLARVSLLGFLGFSAEQSTVASARGARDEIIALPDALQQAQALTSLDPRPLIVVSAGTGLQEGWSAAQEQMAALSTNSLYRVIPTATHTSLISGADAAESSRAILDVVASVRAGTPLR